MSAETFCVAVLLGWQREEGASIVFLAVGDFHGLLGFLGVVDDLACVIAGLENHGLSGRVVEGIVGGSEMGIFGPALEDGGIE